jgi:hypothetical protein
MRYYAASLLVLRLVSCTGDCPLASLFIVNDVLASPGPYLAKFSYACFRFVEGSQWAGRATLRASTNLVPDPLMFGRVRVWR